MKRDVSVRSTSLNLAQSRKEIIVVSNVISFPILPSPSPLPIRACPWRILLLHRMHQPDPNSNPGSNTKQLVILHAFTSSSVSWGVSIPIFRLQAMRRLHTYETMSHVWLGTVPFLQMRHKRQHRIVGFNRIRGPHRLSVNTAILLCLDGRNVSATCRQRLPMEPAWQRIQ